MDDLPRLGSIHSVQVPGGFLQLAKVVENREDVDGIWYVLVYWIGDVTLAVPNHKIYDDRVP